MLATAQATALFILSQRDTIHVQRISIIIPVLNESAGIEVFLQSLREKASGAEIIVADGGSSDGTFDLARDRCDQCLRSDRGRALQMNAGAAAATGDVLWFLHADTKAPANCIQQICDVLVIRKSLAVSFVSSFQAGVLSIV